MLFESKPIIFEGKQYNSQKELAEAFNIRPAQVTAYKNNLEGLRKFIDKKTKNLKPIINPKDRINQIIGTYKIIEFIGNNNRNVPKYKVQCIKCGNILQKDIYNLKCQCNTCKKCKKVNQKDPYVGTIIGDYHIDNLIVHHKNKPATYHATCIECGHTLSQPIFNIKKNCHCSKCKDAIEAYNKFKYYNENGLKCYDVISYEYDYQNKKRYKYLLKCKHCGKEKWINVTTQNLQYLPLCSCQLHENGKHYAKHHNEIINDWLLEDTGKNAYNSRNRLYKYTCIHCGHTYYDQYSQSKLNKLCICQKVQKKKPKVIKEKKKKNIKIDTKHTLYVDFEFDGKVYHKPKEIADAFGITYHTAWSYIKDNDLEGLELTIRQKIYRYKKRMKLS